jgi:hypothetical protein
MRRWTSGLECWWLVAGIAAAKASAMERAEAKAAAARGVMVV